MWSFFLRGLILWEEKLGYGSYGICLLFLFYFLFFYDFYEIILGLFYVNINCFLLGLELIWVVFLKNYFYFYFLFIMLKYKELYVIEDKLVEV